MKRIILDTNFLLIPGRFGIDIFAEIQRIMNFPFEFYIIDKTVDELQKIIETGNGLDKQSARMALDLIKTKGLKTLEYPSKKDVDSLIVEALDNETIVATEDKKLAERIKNKGCQVIHSRQKKYLDMI